ncbi:fluoride efflux transporter CrcB [Suttonella ornithocola]|uniref:Fluoride-specific ion channel FluC n=1 Tax=Suttonella ornithocola TaxID=279832 RepID=A0A380MZG9_9GAMM|nr:fluoride efflux transporter CrcB [Suttonella ornithocola]SUO97624.1 chromosome condensation membrane protein [Suttonella ornithocola]
MPTFFAIFIGGGLGASARHFLSAALIRYQILFSPWAILAVNLLGCFLIGLLAAVLMRQPQPLWRLFIITGFLGGFTTYSSYILDLIQLGVKHLPSALLYLSIHLIGGLLLCGLGIFLGKMLSHFFY